MARTRKRSATSARRVNRRRATSRASNPFRRRRRIINRRRRNATRIVVVAPRRRRHANPRRAYRRVRRYNRRHNRRRNPMQTIAGQNIFSKGGAILIGGGLVGVAAAKFIPTLIPSSIQSTLGGSTIMKVVVTGASAVAAGWLASKVSQAFGEGVLFGGLMQTGSVALNAFLPGFQIAGIPIGLSGFGELLPGSFAIPQNPIRAAIAPPAPPAGSAAGPRLTVSGLSRAYGTAF